MNENHNQEHFKFTTIFVIILMLTLLICGAIKTIQNNGGLTRSLTQAIAQNLVNDSEMEYVQVLNSVGTVIEEINNSSNEANTDDTNTSTDVQNESMQNRLIINNTSNSTISNVEQSSDSLLHEITYSAGTIETITPTDSNYAGEYVITIEPEQEELTIFLTANELATIKVGNDSQKGILNVTKNVKVMFDDMYVNITITAENGDSSLYRVIIHKNTYLSGKVITEGSYSDINIKLIDANDEVAKEFISNDGDILIEIDTENTYKIEIKKAGYLKHTYTNFKAVYGSKNYFGELNLIAGEVAGNDEHINLKDLVQTNKRANSNTVVDETNKKYDFNGDDIINQIDLSTLVKNYNKKARTEEFEIYDVAPIIEEIDTTVEMNSIKLHAIVKDESLDKVIFHINGQNIEGTINREEVIATYEYSLGFDEEITLTVEAIDTTEKTTVSDEVTVTGNLIRTAQDLITLSNNVSNKKTYEGKEIKLAADIDMKDVEFEPIGKSALKTFNGIFDGQEHIISNLNSSSLFGYTKGAKIQKLGINGTIAQTNSNTVAIVEYANSTIVDNCFNTATIEEKENASQIIENAIDCTITNCYCAGDITGVTSYGTEISNCYSISKVDEEENLLESLGDAFKPDYYRQINNGYPILKWQKRIAPFIPALIIEVDGGEYQGELVIEQESETNYTLEEPTKENFTFDGWEVKYGDGTITENVFTFGEDDTSIVAKWKINAFKITYNLDGGQTKTENPIEYTEESEDITLVNPKKEGYAFLGWTGTDLTVTTKKVTIAKGSIGNREYTAVWEEVSNDVYVKLYDNGVLAFTATDKLLTGKTESNVVLSENISESHYTDFSEVPWYNNRTSISSVNIVDKIYPTSTAYWFYMCNKISTINNISNLDTQFVTDMSYMFRNCTYLSTLDVSNFDTSSVTNMEGMFYYCSKVTSINVSNFDTSSVTNMSYMFYYCSKIYGVDLSNFDTSNVTTMSNMFNYCTTIRSFDLSNLDTSSVTDMSYMFCNCKISTLDLSNWDTSSMENMSYMFCNCSSLSSLNISGWDTSNVTNMSRMFSGMSYITNLDVSSLDTKNVENMSGMFYNCSKLTELNLDLFNTAKVTDMSYIFYNCYALKFLDIKSFETHNVENMKSMFGSCSNLKLILGSAGKWDETHATDENKAGMFSSCGTDHVTISDEDVYVTLYDDGTLVFTSSNKLYKDKTKENIVLAQPITQMNFTYEYYRPWDSQKNQVTKVDIVDEIKPISTAFWFYQCKNLTNIDNIQNLDTSEVTNMKSMFYQCSALTQLDVSNFDTRNVTSFENTFLGCSGLTQLNVSNFNTSNATEIRSMFSGCSGLTELDVSNFDTKNIKNFESFFGGCSSLTQLDLSKFDTSSATAFTYLFNNCSGLTSLDLSNFNTENVTTMFYTFNNCSSLETLNISSFDTSKVKSMYYLFNGCSSLTELDLSNFSTESATNMTNMFTGCSELTALNVSGFVTTNVTSMLNMFSGCSKITSLATSNFDTANVTNMSGMFTECNKLSTADVSGFNTAKVTNMKAMFSGCNVLRTINVSGFSTANVTNMASMFSGCNAVESLNVSGFNTAKVTDMSYMFNGCNKVTSLTLTSFSTASVTNMASMFNGCKKVGSLNLSSFTTSNVTDMSSMFNDCESATTINVSRFNTAKVTTMNSMFKNCKSVTSLTLTSFNTAKVTNMGSMFYYCNTLTTLNLKSFSSASIDLDNILSLTYMFGWCSNLSSITVSSSWSKSCEVGNMFGNYCGVSKLTWA